ncbi:MAG: FHA domain-containing protein [Propionibacteriaceae bacterium]|nr:FHA domain-containing protein [Propionibacteriaceae bacterium]
MTVTVSKFADTAASRRQVIVSSAVDVMVACLVVAGFVLWTLAVSTPWPVTAIVGSLVAVVLVLAWWLARTRHGTSLGHWLTGIRDIQPETGLPGIRPGFQAVDIRKGQDPMRLRPRRVSLQPPAAKPQQVQAMIIAVLDDGTRHRLDLPCVVGRNPHVAPPYKCLSVADLSRTVSRTHLLVALEGTDLVISDLGSSSGTTILTAEGEQPLPAELEARVPLSMGTLAQLRLGSREVRIEAVPNLQARR